VIDQSGVRAIHDAEDFAPPRGTIYVPPNLVPENFGFLDFACWEVSEDPSFRDNDEGGAKWKAKRLDRLPAEIVTLDISSSRSDEVVTILCDQGLQVNFNITARAVYVEFSDGVIAGPLTFSRSEDGRRSICEPTQFVEPIPAWKSGALFDTVLFTAEGRYGRAHRRFLSSRQLPPNTDYLDFAPLEHALQSLVKRVCRDGPGSFILPKREQALLVERLMSIQLPTQLEARRRRLQTSLDEALNAGADLERWYPLVSDHPSVKARIEECAQAAAEEAKKELQAEAGELKTEIRNLEGNVGRLKDAIHELEGQKDQVSIQASEAAEGIHKAIIKRAEDAVSDVEGILAQTALLRPFLSTPSSRSTTLAIKREENHLAAALDIGQAYVGLTTVFRQLGLIPGDAAFLARGVLAAALCGQLIRFSGSMSEVVARSAARSIGGDSLIEIQVPPGLMDSGVIDLILDELRSKPRGGSLVLCGVNNACFDLYGGPINDLVVQRTSNSEAVLPHVLCVATVRSAAASLSLSPSEIALGPIFDTDSLSWSSRKGKIVVTTGQLIDFACTLLPPEDQSPQEDLNRALHDWSALQPALWRRCVFQVFSTLRLLCSDDISAATAILSFGWIVPLAEALERDLVEVTGVIATTFPGALESAEALARLLERKGGSR
jgi:hypothetical protein